MQYITLSLSCAAAICRELAELATSRCSICATATDSNGNQSTDSCGCSDRALAKLLSVKLMAAADRQARLKLQLAAEVTAGAAAAAAAAAVGGRWGRGIIDVAELLKVKRRALAGSLQETDLGLQDVYAVSAFKLWHS
jgi:hypothetical protein